MTTSISPRSIQGRAISRGKSPKLPAQLFIPLPFQNDTVFTLQIYVSAQLQNVQGIEGIQSVYIDNSLNAAPLMILLDTGQNITCPAEAQAIFPIFFSGEMLNATFTCAGGFAASVIFLNTREQAQQWSTKVFPGGTFTVSGTVGTYAYTGAFTDNSKALTTGGTSQQLIAANSARRGLLIMNKSTAAAQGIAAAELAYINFGAAAGVNTTDGSIEVPIGGSWFMMSGVPGSAVNFNAATTNHWLVAKEFN